MLFNIIFLISTFWFL